MTTPPESQQAAPGGKKVLDRLFGEGRLLTAVIILVVELALLLIATSVPLGSASQQALQGEANNLSSTVSGLTGPGLFFYIFTHNAEIAYAEMVPVLGAIIWLGSIFVTGQLIQAAAVANGEPGILYGTATLILPFSIVELSAYVVAVTSGTMLLVSLAKHTLRQEARVLALEVGLVAALLSTAAAMETITIEDPYLGLALWVPTGFAIILLVKVVRRVARQAAPVGLL